MAIKLTKSQGINLKKDSSDLKEITFGLGWTQGITKKKDNEKKGFFSKLFNTSNTVENRFVSNSNVDLDATILGYIDGKCMYECSYKSKCSFAESSGDDTTGNNKKTDTDNEQIKIHLNTIPKNIDKLYLIMNIYNCNSRHQTLSMINKAYCNVYDKDMNIMAQFSLDETYGDNTGVLVGEITKDFNGKFNMFTAIGDGYKVSSIDDFKYKIR